MVLISIVMVNIPSVEEKVISILSRQQNSMVNGLGA